MDVRPPRAMRLIALLVAVAGAVTTISPTLAAVEGDAGVVEVRVNSADPRGTTTGDVLTAGRWYTIEARGTYYDTIESAFPTRAADAECTNLGRLVTADPVPGPSEPTWLPNRWGAFGPLGAGDPIKDDPQDLYVDGKSVDWTPVAGGALCDDVTHAYRTSYLATGTRVNLRVYDPFWQYDNAGELVVRISPGSEPVAGPDDVPVGTITVDASNPNGFTSPVPLSAGNTYRIVAGGTFVWDFRAAGNNADAECTRATADPLWKASRFAAAAPTEDLVDLYVNHAKVSWVPLSDDGSGCNTVDHLYRTELRPATTALVNFKVKATLYSVISGSLTVRIYLLRSAATAPGPPSAPPGVPGPPDVVPSRQPAQGTALETLTVPSSAPAGTTSTTVLQSNRYYLLQARGSYADSAYSDPARRSDAECTAMRPDPYWQPNRYGAVGVALQASGAADDPQDLYVDGAPADWQPVGSDVVCSSDAHVYQLLYSPPANRKLNVRVFDPFYYADNVGEITVSIFPAGEPASNPTDILVATALVDSANPEGASSTAPLVAGQTYRIVVGGTYLWDYRAGGNEADGECARTAGDPSWRADRFTASPPGEDLLDVYVNNQKVDWVPLTDTGGGCNAKDHLYRLTFTPTRSGLVKFCVKAAWYGYNYGLLSVKIFAPRVTGQPGPPDAPDPQDAMPSLINFRQPQPGTPLATLAVDSQSPAGRNTPVLQAGRHYLFEVSGTYLDSIYAPIAPERRSDAECTSLPPDPTWAPARYTAVAASGGRAQPTDDPQDLYVDGKPVEWEPVGSGPQCDHSAHTYQVLYSAKETRPVNVRVFDPFYYPDNSGTLTVKVFGVGEPVSALTDVLVGATPVDASNPGGITGPVLVARQTYRIVANGTFTWDYRAGGNEGDPECSRAAGDATWTRDRFAAVVPGEDLLDLYVNGTKVDWEPITDTGGGCNERDHSYGITITPDRTGPVTFKVKSTFYGYNTGSLLVRVFLRAA